jgi:hypothetical protein
MAQPGFPAAIGVTAGQVGQQPGSLGERSAVAPPAGLVAECWAIMVLPTPTGPWRMTDSPASMKRMVARSRMWAAGILGL